MLCSRHSSWRGRFCGLACVLAMLAANCLGQAQTARPAAPAKPKTGQETCDGALDIVPGKSATFMRKRRVPGKKSTSKTELKPENRSSL